MNATPAQQILIYDDGCPMCTFQMRLVTWLDWFNTVTLLPLSHPTAMSAAPGLTREALHEAIHCITPSGRVHRGARALRHIGLRMPLAVPLSLLLWFPGVIAIAERVYGLISRNRYVLSRWFGCQEACAVLPARQRETDVAALSTAVAEPNESGG